MKKNILFLLVNLFFFFSVFSATLFAGDAEDASQAAIDTQAATASAMAGMYENAEEERKAQEKEQVDEFMRGASGAVSNMSTGMEGLENTYAPKSLIKFHVPVNVANLPPEITQIGVRCIVRITDYGYVAEGSVAGSPRDGGRTMIVPVHVRTDKLGKPGRYDCSLWLQTSNGEHIGVGKIRNTIELDTSVAEVVTVRRDL